MSLKVSADWGEGHMIDQIATKLRAEGVTKKNYTKKFAKSKIQGIVAPVWGERMIDKYSPEIKAKLK